MQVIYKRIGILVFIQVHRHGRNLVPAVVMVITKVKQRPFPYRVLVHIPRKINLHGRAFASGGFRGQGLKPENKVFLESLAASLNPQPFFNFNGIYGARLQPLRHKNRSPFMPLKDPLHLGGYFEVFFYVLVVFMAEDYLYPCVNRHIPSFIPGKASQHPEFVLGLKGPCLFPQTKAVDFIGLQRLGGGYLEHFSVAAQFLHRKLYPRLGF